jgi:PKHD-type hydroxylase
VLITQIPHILSPAQVAKVRAILAASPYVDGRVSGGSAESKRNLELASHDERYVEILTIVDNAVRDNAEFNLTAFPRYMTRPIISRYDVGMFYKDHVDMPVMGFMSARTNGKGFSALGHNYVRSDLSMTLFLSDPETYDGGALAFDGPAGKVQTKLEAGSAIVYPTGAWHCVTPVTRGTRQAAIFWIQSMFPVEAQRQAVCDARRLYERLRQAQPEAEETSRAEALFFNLCRMFAAV